MKQLKENQQKDIIEYLKAYPWSRTDQMIARTGSLYPTTIISRIRERYGYEAIEDRPYIDKEGKPNGQKEYRLSPAFKAMLDVKKPIFPSERVFKNH